MNQKNVLNLVIDEIYQLESFVQGWRDMQTVPSIEKDLVQRKLQQIYEQIRYLDTSVDSIPEVKHAIKTEEPVKVAPEPIRASTPEPIKEVTPVKEVTHEPEITIPGPVHEIVFEKKTEIIEESKPAIQEIPLKTEPVQQIVEVTVTKTQVETEKVKEVPKEILAEKLTHSHKFVNETIKTRTVMDVSSKLKASPIASIQSAINLNDKFVFIRELFKNNNLLYNQTIERLNNAMNYEDAMSIIQREFAWDLSDPLVTKLVELIKRKHNA